MNREKDENVMKGLMEILVRRLSCVFGKSEREVREAVEEEMVGLEAGYKKWLSAMSSSLESSSEEGEKAV